MQKMTKTASYPLCYEIPVQKCQPAWRLFLNEPLSRQTKAVALLVAERLRDPDVVKAAVKLVGQQSIYSLPNWSPIAVGSGDAGLALMYTYLDECFPGQGWDSLAQLNLSLVAVGTQRMTFTYPGLLGGAGGLALTLFLASKGGRRYQRTLARIHQGLCDQVFAHSWRRVEEEEGVASPDFDVISGAAGVLAYLVSVEQANTAIHRAISKLLAYLVWLAEPDQPLGKERWYIPPTFLPNDMQRKTSPQGNFNCGLAHGMPGPLAALALTWLAGYRYPGLRESIAYLANWIVAHQLEGEWGRDWPAYVPLADASAEQDWKALSPTHTAWCYGTPGVSRSLWLAGQALGEKRLLQASVEAIEAVLRRPVSQRDIPSPNLCHGTAGLLQICLRFAQECESTLIKEHIPVLVEQILAAFDPHSTFGFRDVVAGNISIDQPGWLTGAPGVAMALLAASTEVVPAWDRILVIA